LKLALVLAVAAFAVAATALAVAVFPLGPDVGPLGRGTGNAESAPIPAGVTRLEVADEFANRGEAPVLFQGVELIDASPGIEVGDVLIAGPGALRARTLALGPRQSRERLLGGGFAEATGQVIAPQDWFAGAADYHLMINLRVPGPGNYSFHGYEVHYVADGEEHADRAGPEVTFCVGTTRPGHACPVHG
jgi:hypothetical protein